MSVETENLNNLAIKNDFKNPYDYREKWAVEKGFKNFADYCNYRNHKKGKSKPMSENKNCPVYLGVHIAEERLSLIFDNVKRMPYGNPGFDFICGKGFKIDVKSSCLSEKYDTWNFALRYNTIANYFLFLAFDNRDDLNPMHIYLIKNDESMDKVGTTIHNTSKSLKKWERYELTNKLEKLIACCSFAKDDKEIMGMFA